MSSAQWHSVSASHTALDKRSDTAFLTPVHDAPGRHASVKRDNTAASLNTGPIRGMASLPSDTTTTTLRSLSPATAQQLARSFPAVHTLLIAQQASLTSLQGQVEAKQAELVQCIRTGRELVVHVDALTQRCTALARERDALRQRLATSHETKAVALRDGEDDTETVAAADLLLAAMLVLELNALVSPSRAQQNNAESALSAVTCSELPTTQQALQRWLLRALQELKATCESAARLGTSQKSQSRAKDGEAQGPARLATTTTTTSTRRTDEVDARDKESEWRGACSRAEREADTLRVELDTLHRHVVPTLNDEVLELRKQSKIREAEATELRRTVQELRTQCTNRASRERALLQQIDELHTRCTAAERNASTASSQGQRDAAVVHNLQHGLEAAEQEIRLRQAQLRQRESELDELRRHRRAAERIVMDALSETQDWQGLVMALREVQSRVAQGLPAEPRVTEGPSVDEKDVSLGSALSVLLTSVQDLVEDVIERQTRRWQSVRQRVLHVYDAPSRSAAITAGDSAPHTSDSEEEELGAVVDQGLAVLPAATQEANGEDEPCRRHVARLHSAIDTLCACVINTTSRHAAESQSSALEQNRAIAALRAEHEAATRELRTALEHAAAAQHAELTDQIETLQRRTVADQARLQTTLDELERSRAQVSRLERRLREAEAQAESLTRGVSAARTRGEVQCAALQQRLEQLQAHYDALLTRCEAERTAHERERQTQCDEAEQRVRQGQAALRAAAEEKRALQETLQKLRAELDGTLARVQEEHNAAEHELQRRLRVSQEQLELQLAREAATQEEMQTLRQVNASLEARLQALERDRDPLRRQLHDLLKLSTSERSTVHTLTSPSRS